MNYVIRKFKNGLERGYIRFHTGKFIRLTPSENAEFQTFLAKKRQKR